MHPKSFVSNFWGAVQKWQPRFDIYDFKQGSEAYLGGFRALAHDVDLTLDGIGHAHTLHVEVFSFGAIGGYILDTCGLTTECIFVGGDFLSYRHGRG